MKLLWKDGSGRLHETKSWLDGAGETKLPGAAPAGIVAITALPLRSSLGARQRDGNPSPTLDATKVPSL